MKAKFYTQLAGLVYAYHACLRKGNDFAATHKERIEALVKEYMPSGSGFDSGTTLDLDRSSGEKLHFDTSYHHMDDGGSYDGWTEHSVIVRPSLVFGFELKVTGRDRNDIKDYIGEVFHNYLSSEETNR